eukprot:PhF_6_TR30451/c0_g1_i3/m.44718
MLLDSTSHDIFDQWVSLSRDYLQQTIQKPRTQCVRKISYYLEPQHRLRLHEAGVRFPSSDDDDEATTSARTLHHIQQLIMYGKHLQSLLATTTTTANGDNLISRIVLLPSVYHISCPLVLRTMTAPLTTSSFTSSTPIPLPQVNALLHTLGCVAKPSFVEVLRLPPDLEGGGDETTSSNHHHHGCCFYSFTKAWKEVAQGCSQAEIHDKSNFAAAVELLLTQITCVLHVRVDTFSTKQTSGGGGSIICMLILLSDVAVVMETLGWYWCGPMLSCFTGKMETSPSYGTSPTTPMTHTTLRKLIAKLSIVFGIGFDKIRQEIRTLTLTVFLKSPKKVTAEMTMSPALGAVLEQIADPVLSVRKKVSPPPHEDGVCVIHHGFDHVVRFMDGVVRECISSYSPCVTKDTAVWTSRIA